MPSRRIVVIGAGLAGLDGVDMGAHWIHGTEGNPITGLLARDHPPLDDGPWRHARRDYDRFRRFLLVFPEASLALLGASITRLTDAERRSVAASIPICRSVSGRPPQRRSATHGSRGRRRVATRSSRQLWRP
jgi:hypothetical protein